MSIDGKKIANDILQSLQNDVSLLKKRGLTPTLAVILVGDDPGSASYVRQKQKTAQMIGVELRSMRYDVRCTKEEIQSAIEQLNNDPLVHGIIVQRPLPKHLQDKELLNSVDLTKDIDGFVPESKFEVPVAKGVMKILQKSYELRHACRQAGVTSYEEKKFFHWLKQQSIVVIGRGETAGKPIAEYLIQQGCHVSIIHSQTTDKEKQHQILHADIIISCVGKERVITKKNIKQGATLISVGIWRDSEGKLHGDYEEVEIKDIASFYTPTPGGVGPVNVACLMENLLTACTSHPLSVH